MNKKIISKDDEKSKIISEIVGTLKPQIKESIEELRKDLYNDFKENFQPAAAPVPPQPDLSKLGDILKDGNLDVSKISQLMGSMQAAAPASDPNTPPVDLSKLTSGQVEYMKMQQQDKMIGMILPLIIGQGQSTQNPLIGEMMNRIFLEKINSSIYMDKAMLNMMVKNFGGTPPPDSGLTTPVSDSIAKLGKTNVVK